MVQINGIRKTQGWSHRGRFIVITLLRRNNRKYDGLNDGEIDIISFVQSTAHYSLKAQSTVLDNFWQLRAL